MVSSSDRQKLGTDCIGRCKSNYHTIVTQKETISNLLILSLLLTLTELLTHLLLFSCHSWLFPEKKKKFSLKMTTNYKEQITETIKVVLIYTIKMCGNVK